MVCRKWEVIVGSAGVILKVGKQLGAEEMEGQKLIWKVCVAVQEKGNYP